MKNQLRHVMGTAAIALTAALTHAAFSIDWSTIDSGGGPVNGGTFAINGSIGQHDASAPVAGGTFAISPGYWQSTPPPACPGDFNTDGLRNTSDLVSFLSNFGQTVPPGNPVGDFNNDNVINTSDLVAFLSVFGVPCP